jgi:hypothetical protein
MKKLFAWLLILVILGSIFRIVLSYFLEEQSFKTYTRETDYTVTLYFPNEKKDPKREVCDYVLPVERHVLASKVNVPLKTIELLFAGPTDAEKLDGAYSVIPKDAILALFAIAPEAIELVIDYDKTRLTKCSQTLFTAQIEKTLGQFNIALPVLINPDYLIQTVIIHEK